jgi:hypothetical protein
MSDFISILFKNSLLVSNLLTTFSQLYNHSTNLTSFSLNKSSISDFAANSNITVVDNTTTNIDHTINHILYLL